jgi:DNA mismatch repair protein MutL
MNRIRLLPEHVANQIAAGEVVERPASVVKELVENSLDARASRIVIEIQAGGRSLIRVTDDGAGMSRDDALLCLERHATSKIQKAEDLASIDSMGFRGEALPSIASVSRFVLTTREADSESPEGTQVVINGGKIVEVKAAGTAPGTSLEVRQLFFNLPARRKFLRTEETEAAHIDHYLTLAAIAHPEVAFTFHRDGRIVWQLPAVKTGRDTKQKLEALRERLKALHGSDQRLIAVSFTGEMTVPAVEDEHGIPIAEPRENHSVKIWGLIGAPGVSRSTREDQHVFVNRRPVENRGLNYALMEGYHTALMKGRFPVCSLFLEINPAEVDVNIHPAKREVKFHREGEVRRIMTQAIRQTLLAYHSADSNAAGRMTMQPQRSGGVAAPANITPFPGPATPPQPGPESPASSQPALPSFPPALVPRPEVSTADLEQIALRIGFGRKDLEGAEPLASTIAPPNNSFSPQGPPTVPSTAAAAPLLQVPLRLVGVIGRLYVVLESDRGLVLLDQHAAHERILFEQMLDRLESKTQAASQRLLLPSTVELSARDAHFLNEHLSILTRLGVGLSEFGERTFLLDALPPFVKAPDARQFVIQLVDELKAAGQQVNSLRLGEHVVAKTVCRHAIKANDPLAGPELENLIRDLRHCAMPYTCPHGRPTLIEMNFKELEKKFGRTQMG